MKKKHMKSTITQNFPCNTFPLFYSHAFSRNILFAIGFRFSWAMLCFSAVMQPKMPNIGVLFMRNGKGMSSSIRAATVPDPCSKQFMSKQSSLTAKTLLSPQRAYLISVKPEGGSSERGLIHIVKTLAISSVGC